MSRQVRSQQIFITMEDGSLSVMSFVIEGRSSVLPFGARRINPDDGAWLRAASAENVAAEFAKTFTPDRLQPVSWRLAREGETLPERTFRDAWVDTDGRVGHDIEKAKEIRRDQLRVMRTPQLDELDREYNRAVGLKLGQAELEKIEAARQVLRDAPADPRIDAAVSIDDLKAVTLTNSEVKGNG